MNLRKVFKKSKMSQTELAKLTNLSQTTISTWVSGESVSSEADSRIAKALKTKKKVKAEKLDIGRPRIFEKGESGKPMVLRFSAEDREQDMAEAKRLGYKNASDFYRYMRKVYYEARK